MTDMSDAQGDYRRASHLLRILYWLTAVLRFETEP